MDLDDILTAEGLFKARKALAYLKLYDFIDKQQEEEVLKAIDKREKDGFWFITRPFRYNEAVSKSSHTFMRHMINALKKRLHEDR